MVLIVPELVIVLEESEAAMPWLLVPVVLIEPELLIVLVPPAA